MRVLLLDIETAPNLAHVWGLRDQNISTNQLIAASYVMCWAAKWYKDSELYFDSVKKSKPEKMLQRIHKMICEADVVVHFNGKSFDMPTLNKEFLGHQMLPPDPYRQVDLCLTARHEFRFPSNKLEYLARHLGLGKKIEHEGHELWVSCMANDPAAWRRMEAYNKQDVVLLEKLYDRLRPWVRNHPNAGVYDNGLELACPACGSTSLQSKGWRYTQVNKYKRYLCKDCGKSSHGAKGEYDLHTRRNILRPTPNN